MRLLADEAAFRTLYRRHGGAIHLYALRLAGGHDGDAEEIAQETWFKAVRGLASFRWESSLRTWLRRIALNVWRARIRVREPAWLDVNDLPLAGPSPSPGDRLDLERALAALPPGYRTVFLLHDWEGLTHDEIAEALGIAAGTSKSQLSQARARLRELLGEVQETV